MVGEALGALVATMATSSTAIKPGLLGARVGMWVRVASIVGAELGGLVNAYESADKRVASSMKMLSRPTAFMADTRAELFDTTASSADLTAFWKPVEVLNSDA